MTANPPLEEGKEPEFYISTFSMVASLAISVYQITKHFNNYNEPALQLHIVRILLMVPVYATATWLSLTYDESNYLIYCSLRDCYEGYVLYLFMQLLI